MLLDARLQIEGTLLLFLCISPGDGEEFFSLLAADGCYYGKNSFRGILCGGGFGYGGCDGDKFDCVSCGGGGGTAVLCGGQLGAVAETNSAASLVGTMAETAVFCGGRIVRRRRHDNQSIKVVQSKKITGGTMQEDSAKDQRDLRRENMVMW
jgi:hypothetical protein